MIGQIARNSNVPKDTISRAELLKIANTIIGEAVKLVGGRNILVECRKNEKMIQFYINNGFSQVPDENHTMIQLIRRFEFGGYAS